MKKLIVVSTGGGGGQFALGSWQWAVGSWQWAVCSCSGDWAAGCCYTLLSTFFPDAISDADERIATQECMLKYKKLVSKIK